MRAINSAPFPVRKRRVERTKNNLVIPALPPQEQLWKNTHDVWGTENKFLYLLCIVGLNKLRRTEIGSLTAKVGNNLNGERVCMSLAVNRDFELIVISHQFGDPCISAWNISVCRIEGHGQGVWPQVPHHERWRDSRRITRYSEVSSAVYDRFIDSFLILQPAESLEKDRSIGPPWNIALNERFNVGRDHMGCGDAKYGIIPAQSPSITEKCNRSLQGFLWRT